MADTPETERQAVEPETGEVLSVSQPNDRIASVVEDAPALDGVRCIGEVTDLHQNTTALYFTLTDGDAELPCMIWANRYRTMDADLEDGTEVIVVGDGDQAAAVERLRRELDEPGWFDDEQKQRPPAFPERVGVVTSLRGDARYDIQRAIHEQDPTVDDPDTIGYKHVSSFAPPGERNRSRSYSRQYEVEAPPVDAAIDEGWATVAPSLEFSEPIVSRVMDDVQRYIANADDRPADEVERADAALAALAAQQVILSAITS